MESSPVKSKEFLTVQDAAQLLRCSVSAVRKWIRLGKIRALRASRLVRIRRDDLDSFLREE
jgi:excisionase family DNA binding protein